MIFVTWEDVFNRLKEAPAGKLYGVPRGGAIVAALSGRMADSPEKADVIVDDIVDSGRTRERYARHNKPFWALFEKQHGDGWVNFPWEQTPEKDIEDSVARLLQFVGEDAARDGLKETPARVVRALQEMTAGYQQDPARLLSKTFEVPYDEMVLLKDIEFWSLCEHHMVPFHGKVHIGYIPQGRVVGISKLARVAHCFARRLQIQERLTQQIAHAIQAALNPLGVGVVVEATHLCMAMRGVKTPGNMVTSCLLGVFRDKARSEFLRLIRPL